MVLYFYTAISLSISQHSRSVINDDVRISLNNISDQEQSIRVDNFRAHNYVVLIIVYQNNFLVLI